MKICLDILQAFPGLAWLLPEKDLIEIQKGESIWNSDPFSTYSFYFFISNLLSLFHGLSLLPGVNNKIGGNIKWMVQQRKDNKEGKYSRG